MIKSNLIFKGKIINCLPNANFIVLLEDDRIIKAYISGKIRKNYIKISIGDKVKIELNNYDKNKGRIIFRESI